MVNKAYMDTLTQSMREMDAEFHFMDDDMRDKVTSMHLTGVKVNGIDSVERVIPETYEEDRLSFWDERDGKKHVPLETTSDEVTTQTDASTTTPSVDESVSEPALDAKAGETGPTAAVAPDATREIPMDVPDETDSASVEQDESFTY